MGPGFIAQQAAPAHAAHGIKVLRADLAEFQQRRRNVLHLGQLRNIPPMLDPGLRPSEEARDAVAALPHLGFMPAHAAVVDIGGGLRSRAIVTEIQYDRIFLKTVLHEKLLQPAHIFVDIRNLSVIRSRHFDLCPVGPFPFPDVGIRFRVFLGNTIGNMRQIVCQIDEEWLIIFFACRHVFHRLSEPDVAGIALVADIGAVMFQHRIHIRLLRTLSGVQRAVCPIRSQRRESPGTERQDFLEPAVLRAVGIAVTHVPFAEEAGRIAGISKIIGQHRNVFPNHRSPGIDRRAAVLHGVHPGHQLPSRRRAHRRDMEIGEADALRVQFVHVRCFEKRMPVGSDVSIPLVVRQDDDDVGLVGRGEYVRSN